MKFRFVKILFIVVVGMLFAKVYQHNVFVKGMYGLQHLKHEKNRLKKYKAELLLKYNEERNLEKIYAWAVQERGMRPCSLQVMTSLEKGGMLHGDGE